MLASGGASLGPWPAAAKTPDAADWVAWKAAFLAEDGRVIDHLQEQATHSEAQGYALVLAEWFGDAEVFRRIFQWTEAYLAVRNDPLLAWRWRPGAVPQIDDYNNASDGDLFYAWALARAAYRFAEPSYLARAKAIAEFLSDACLRPDPRDPARLVFLPAAEGFQDADSVTINPSYIMPLAMKELGLRTQTDKLLQASSDGESLLAEFAEAGLIPDWVTLTTQDWAISPRHSALSGYEAIRCSLFLIWSGLTEHPAVLNAAVAYKTTAGAGESPIVFDLAENTLRETSRYPGYAAVAALALCREPLPEFIASQPYYPATLHLFAKIAAHVGRPGSNLC
nr:glycosyl hydrolase family 8 [Szabonella alba]